MEVAMDSIAGISNHQSDTALTNQAITQDSLSLSLSQMNRINPSINLSFGGARNQSRIIIIKKKRLVCVSLGVWEGEVLFFVPSSIGSCWFLLLVAWSVSRVSCLVCV